MSGSHRRHRQPVLWDWMQRKGRTARKRHQQKPSPSAAYCFCRSRPIGIILKQGFDHRLVNNGIQHWSPGCSLKCFWPCSHWASLLTQCPRTFVAKTTVVNGETALLGIKQEPDALDVFDGHMQGKRHKKNVVRSVWPSSPGLRDLPNRVTRSCAVTRSWQLYQPSKGRDGRQQRVLRGTREVEGLRARSETHAA